MFVNNNIVIHIIVKKDKSTTRCYEMNSGNIAVGRYF